MGLNIFYNDKDPDNILKEAISLKEKFVSIKDRCISEKAEWTKRDDDAYAEYLAKKAECDAAKQKLNDAEDLADKFLTVFN